MKKLLAILVSVFLFTSQAFAVLPNQLKTARMTDATLASTIDNEVGNLEQAVCDILGIPCNTNISNALFVVTANGLTNVVFQDLVGSPTAAGRLARNGANLEFHDGTAARVLANTANVQTLTNKSIALGSNTISGTLAQFNTAVTDADLASLAGIETLTNKTAALGSNTISGTIAQFNTALTDGDFATLAGIESLTNKTIPAPVLSGTATGTYTLGGTPTIASPVISGAAPATPVANVLYSDLVVKGWLETSGAGLWTIDADVNVSSITDNAVGDFTINWATAFATANYPVLGTVIGGSSSVIAVVESTVTAKTVSLVRLRVIDETNTENDPLTGVSIIAIGAQ